MSVDIEYSAVTLSQNWHSLLHRNVKHRYFSLSLQISLRNKRKWKGIFNAGHPHNRFKGKYSQGVFSLILQVLIPLPFTSATSIIDFFFLHRCWNLSLVSLFFFLMSAVFQKVFQNIFLAISACLISHFLDTNWPYMNDLQTPGIQFNQPIVVDS